MRLLTAYLAILFAMAAIDLVWLGVVARKFYRDQLGSLLRDKPRLLPAAAFYLLYPIGILMFASLPGSEARSVLHAGVLGTAFGFFAYATYDLTNLAVLRGWPVLLAFVDMAWGSVLTGLCAAAGTWISLKF